MIQTYSPLKEETATISGTLSNWGVNWSTTKYVLLESNPKLKKQPTTHQGTKYFLLLNYHFYANSLYSNIFILSWQLLGGSRWLIKPDMKCPSKQTKETYVLRMMSSRSCRFRLMGILVLSAPSMLLPHCLTSADGLMLLAPAGNWMRQSAPLMQNRMSTRFPVRST